MLQHYSPYKVAENFNLLASLAPGRVDLGVGKAPGGLPLSTQALQLGVHQNEKGSFAEQLSQLNGWLALIGTETGQTVFPTPIPPTPPQRFVLGASVASAQLAAESDWNFIFAAHLNGDPALLRDVLTYWQANSSRPTIVAVQVIVAHSAEIAAQLAENVQIWGVELEDGQRVTVASEEQALAFAAQAGSAPRKIARRAQTLLHGTALEVAAKLHTLHAEHGIDEFIIDTPVAEGHARLTSLRLLAQAHSVVEVV
jgi:luciferase family oxidoreductase group 1